MPGSREVVPDTIRLAEVDLVGRLSDESVMGHLGVVLFDVESWNIRGSPVWQTTFLIRW